MNDVTDNDAAIATRWLVVFWVLASLALIVVGFPKIMTLALPDTDDAMRMLQVRDWLSGQTWSDLVQHRLGPAAGTDMHWSRVVDLPLAATIALSAPVFGMEVAEKIAATLIPLLTLGLTMLAAGQLGTRIAGRRAGLIAAMFILSVGPVVYTMRPLRIDHHGWQAALLLFMVAQLADPERRMQSGFVAGLALVLSLAIGLETLPYIALVSMALVAAWWVHSKYGVLLQGYGLAILIGLAVFYPLFVPQPAWFVPYCDALSPPYLAAFGGAGLVAIVLPGLMSNSGFPTKAIMSLMVLSLIAAATGYFYPACAAGPLGAVDPRLATWLGHISEAKPGIGLIATKPATSLSFALFLLVGLIAGSCAAFCRRENPLGWGMILSLLVAGLALTLFVQLRSAIAVSTFAAVAAAALAAQWLPRARAIKALLPRVLATAGLLLGLSGAGSLWLSAGYAKLVASDATVTEEAEEASALACADPRTLAALDVIAPSTLATTMNMGPAVLLHTHHRATAGPYHRGVEMILDNMELWRAEPLRARQILMSGKADYLLHCPGAVELTNAVRDVPDGFAHALEAGTLPPWLEPVALDAIVPLKLYRIKN